jgi:hypothetical protein
VGAHQQDLITMSADVGRPPSSPWRRGPGQLGGCDVSLIGGATRCRDATPLCVGAVASR